VLTLVSYAVSRAEINAGSVSVLVVQKTSIGINVLGSLALLVGVVWVLAVTRGRFRGLIVRWWTIVLGLVIAFLLLRASAVVNGGEMDTAGPAQLLAVSVAFVGFWVGFYGKERQILPQAMFVFGTLTAVYWFLDLSALPSVVGSGAPFTSFAGNGLYDSDFVYPFGTAVGYVVAKGVLRILRSPLERLGSVLDSRFAGANRARFNKQTPRDSRH